jgi:hypothetical protein
MSLLHFAHEISSAPKSSSEILIASVAKAFLKAAHLPFVLNLSAELYIENVV